MTKLLGPYGLSAAGQAPFDVEWDQLPEAPIGVDISNISGLLLFVNVAGSPYWLAPWTARYFPVPQNSIKVTITSDGDLSPAAADPLRLIAEIYTLSDTPPDQKQRSLSSLALLAGISGQVTLANGAVVSLTGGTVVGVSGTPNVAVTNTPGVTVNNTPGVTVGNTVGVQNTTLTALFQNPTATLLSSGTVQAASGFFAINVSSGIPATTRSMLLVIVPQSLASGTNTITQGTGTGTPSQENWLTFGVGNSISIAGFAAVSPIYFPFYASIDSSINISIGLNNGTDNTSTFKYWLMALPDADILGTPNNPLVINDVDNEKASTPFFAIATSSGSANILATPPNGTLWDIVGMMIYFGSAFTAAGNATIVGTTSNTIYLGASNASGGALGAQLSSRFRINEGLKITSTAIGANTGAGVIAKQVPAAA